MEVLHPVLHRRLVRAGVVQALLPERAPAAVQAAADVVVFQRGLVVGGLLRLERRLAEARPYSYRDDPAVPKFPDDKALIVFDGVCVLCSRLVQFAIDRDPDAQFRLCTVQSDVGRALFRHYGLDTETYETNLVLVDGRAYGKLDSVAIVGRIGRFKK